MDDGETSGSPLKQLRSWPTNAGIRLIPVVQAWLASFRVVFLKPFVGLTKRFQLGNFN